MDTTDPDIFFNADGVCTHCLSYQSRISARIVAGAEGARQLAQIVERIKQEGAGKEYDCIAGVSGGVDSTYVVYLAKKYGLRPLAVHFDNGWNSELAVSNIEKVLKCLNVDLYTYVVNWEEFRDLQLAFLRASTPDGEIPTDHGIYALLLRVAREQRVRFILNGMNFATEAMSVPAWAYGHSDWRYIKDVHRRFGKVPLRTFPHYSITGLAYAMLVRKVQFVSFLNYIPYDKQAAIATLESDLGWRAYGGKHHESIYTRFFQAYILPSKFKIDKRKGHLSDLINSGYSGMTRAEALLELERPACDPKVLAEDREYVIKKLGITEQEFEAIMRAEIRSFRDYRTNFALINRLKAAQQALRKLGVFYR